MKYIGYNNNGTATFFPSPSMRQGNFGKRYVLTVIEGVTHALTEGDPEPQPLRSVSKEDREGYLARNDWRFYARRPKWLKK